MISASYYFVFFAFAAAVAFLLTPIVRNLAIRFHVVDSPNDRKPHESSMPTMGGIAMIGAFFITAYLADVVYYAWFHTPLFLQFKITHLLIGAAPLVFLGIVDDKWRVHYGFKLAVQIATATLMLSFHYRIEGITNPLNGQTIPLGFFGGFVTILWFLVIVNAINLMDGIDGLAAGISLIAVLTILVVSLYLGNMKVAVLAVIFAGSIVGFLRYNFYPASIFMGDTGSLFLGFLIAALSLHGAQKSSTAVALAVPVAILGLPIMDALIAVIRRWSTGWADSRSLPARFFAWQRVFSPDLNHIHHRLLALGLTKRQAAIFLYLVAIGFGLTGFTLTAARYQHIALILLYMGVVFFIAFRKFPVFHVPLPQESAGPEAWTSRSEAHLFQLSQSGLRIKQRFHRLLFWTIGILLPLIVFVGFLVASPFFH